MRARGSQTEVSFSAGSFWRLLTEAGLSVDFPSSGKPGVRGQSGYAFRWGEGWLGPIRDGGLGWNFERSATSEIDQRVNILLKLFDRRRVEQLALTDALASQLVPFV